MVLGMLIPAWSGGPRTHHSYTTQTVGSEDGEQGFDPFKASESTLLSTFHFILFPSSCVSGMFLSAAPVPFRWAPFAKQGRAQKHLKDSDAHYSHITKTQRDGQSPRHTLPFHVCHPEVNNSHYLLAAATKIEISRLWVHLNIIGGGPDLLNHQDTICLQNWKAREKCPEKISCLKHVKH